MSARRLGNYHEPLRPIRTSVAHDSFGLGCPIAVGYGLCRNGAVRVNRFQAQDRRLVPLLDRTGSGSSRRAYSQERKRGDHEGSGSYHGTHSGPREGGFA